MNQAIANTIIKLLVFGLMVSGLLACGFQLRGQPDLPDSLRQIAVECDGNNYWALCQRLRQQLAANGAQILETAPYTLRIHQVRTDQRTAAVDPDATAAEYELSKHARYQLLESSSSRLLAEREVSHSRLYRHNSARLIAVYREKERIGNSLEQQLADNIVLELAHFNRQVIDDIIETQFEGRHPQ